MKSSAWKWWHFVAVGALILGFGAYQLWDVQIKRGIGSVVVGLICIAVGLFSRGSENGSEAPPDEEPNDREGLAGRR